MKLSSLIAGAQILTTYFDDPDGYHVGAEHDQIFVYATDRPVSEDDRTRLAELGWVQGNVDEGEYDPEEAWVHIT